jgi:nucleotide-binding universal stress UspA family protein
MFTKILIPTDGSDGAMKAAEMAVQLGEKFDAQCIFIHVIQPLIGIPTIATGDILPATVISPEEQEQWGKQIIERMVAAYKEYRHGIKTRLEWGNPVERICSAAEEEEANLIVIGSRGVGGLEELLTGSVSSGVVHHAPCPVLVIR